MTLAQLQTAVSPPCAAPLARDRRVGTDPNRRLSDVLRAIEPIGVERNEASLFRGQYRIVRLCKPEIKE